MGAHFRAEADRLTAILRDAARDGLSPDTALQHVLASVAGGVDGWTALFTDALQAVGQAAGQRLIDRWIAEGLLPKGTTYDPARIGSQLTHALTRGDAAQAARSVVATTQEALDGQLSTTIDASQIDDLITNLQQQYADWQAGRVNSIADTQVVGDWSLGELDAAFQAHNVTGAQAVRTWVTMGDARVRPEHAAADGQQVGLGEPFDVGGEQLMYPCDPNGSPGNVINCRCILDWSLQLATGGDTSSDDLSLD